MTWDGPERQRHDNDLLHDSAAGDGSFAGSEHLHTALHAGPVSGWQVRKSVHAVLNRLGMVRLHMGQELLLDYDSV